MASESESLPGEGPKAEAGGPTGGGQGGGKASASTSGAVVTTSAVSVATPERTPLLPTTGAVVQAAAFGASLSAVSAGIADTLRVKAGEMTPAEAVKDVAKSSLQGATTMAVASTVAHMVRARPMIGLGILAVAGVGLFMMLSESKKKAKKKAEPAT